MKLDLRSTKIKKSRRDKKYRYLFRVISLKPTLEYPQKYYANKRTSSKPPEKDTKYMGNGVILNVAIRTLGKENFKKEIISIHSNEESLMYARNLFIQENAVVFDPDYFNVTYYPKSGEYVPILDLNTYTILTKQEIIDLSELFYTLEQALYTAKSDDKQLEIENEIEKLCNRFKRFQKKYYHVYNIKTNKMEHVLKYSNIPGKEYDPEIHIKTSERNLLDLKTMKVVKGYSHQLISDPEKFVSTNHKMFLLYSKEGLLIDKDITTATKFKINNGIMTTFKYYPQCLLKTKPNHPDSGKIIITLRDIEVYTEIKENSHLDELLNNHKKSIE